MDVKAELESDLDELVELVLTSSRVFVAMAARSLAEADVDVTLPQYRRLVVLAARGPQNLGSLAELLGVSASTATRMCERLVRKRLLLRRSSQRDRRKIRLTLTSLGRVIVDDTTRLRRMELRRLLEAVPAEQQRALVQALAYLNAAAGEVPDREWLPSDA